MGQKELYESLESNSTLRQSYKLIEALRMKYPYFSVPNILLAKISKLNASESFKNELNKAAFYSNDRPRLHALISQENGPYTSSDSWSTPAIGNSTSSKELAKPAEQSKDLEFGHSVERSSEADPVQEPMLQDEANIIEKESTILLESEASEEIEELEKQLTTEILSNSYNLEEQIEPKERKEIEEPKEQQYDPGLSMQPILGEKKTLLEWFRSFRTVDETSKELEILEDLYEEYELDNVKKRNISLLPDPSKVVRSKRKLKSSVENRARKSVDFASIPVSETLAEIFISQGEKEKAILVYQKLGLKYPEKMSTFAARIKELKT